MKKPLEIQEAKKFLIRNFRQDNGVRCEILFVPYAEIELLTTVAFDPNADERISANPWTHYLRNGFSLGGSQMSNLKDYW